VVGSAFIDGTGDVVTSEPDSGSWPTDPAQLARTPDKNTTHDTTRRDLERAPDITDAEDPVRPIRTLDSDSRLIAPNSDTSQSVVGVAEALRI